MVVGAVNRILAYQICIPYKKDKEVLISTVAGAVFNLLANVILINFFDVSGAAIATLCSELIVFCVLTVYIRPFFETYSLYKRMPVYFCSSIWFLVVREVVDICITDIVLKLVVTICICSLGYFIFLIIIKDPYLKMFLRKGKEKLL